MDLPGNQTHQKILKLLIGLFSKDKNIEAFILFGSLVRGNWDDYSDLDLDAVVIDDNKEIVRKEIKQMLDCLQTAGLNISVAFEEFSNEQVIILDSLDRISIRFHLLHDTNSSILDSMQILCGKLTKTQIIDSTQKKKTVSDIQLLLNKFLELSIYVPLSLKRNKLINAVFFITKMRQVLIQIFNTTHNISREFDFESKADEKLIQELYKTYPLCNNEDIKKAFNILLDVFLNNIENISSGRITLNDSQIKLLEKVKNY